MHLEDIALPSAHSLEAGATRIQFQGQDHFVNGVVFTIGRRPGCDLTLANDSAVDEHIFIGANMEKMAKLNPVFSQTGTITAANSSGITDGAV